MVFTVGLVSGETMPMASPKLTPIVYGLVNTDDWILHSPNGGVRIF